MTKRVSFSHKLKTELRLPVRSLPVFRTYLVSNSTVVGPDALNSHNLLLLREKARVERGVGKESVEKNAESDGNASEEDKEDTPAFKSEISSGIVFCESPGHYRAEDHRHSVAGEPDACGSRVERNKSPRGLYENKGG